MNDITWGLSLISIIGTVFNIRKKVVCFYIWMLGDILWWIFDVLHGCYGRACLDFLQVILAFWGMICWNKKFDS